VFPDKVNLTFDTAPGGLTVYLDGIAHTAPFVYDTLIGFQHTIEARDQTVGSSTYTFASWSDGGAQQHTLTVPTAAQSYTATYTVVASPLPAGLSAGWNFNEASGTSAADMSGNNNSATLVNGVGRTTGVYGGGLTFDGVNDYLTVPNSTSLNISGTGLTLTMWINPQALAGGDSVVLGKFWTTAMTSPYYQYGLELSGGTVPNFFIGTTGGPLTASMGSALPLNQWTYLAVAFNGTQVSYYVNGAVVSTVPLSATITPTTNPFRIGADITAQQFFKGSLDEVRLYNRALTAQEVQTDMASAALLAEGGALAEHGAVPLLTEAQLAPILDTAKARWVATGLTAEQASALAAVEIKIVDLEGATLGRTAGTTVWLDQTAAGYGWFVDSTPADNAEYHFVNSLAEWLAHAQGPAAGGMDLLTAITHELGHVLGFGDQPVQPQATNLMANTLAVGVRRSVMKNFETALPVTKEESGLPVKHTPTTRPVIEWIEDDSTIGGSVISNGAAQGRESWRHSFLLDSVTAQQCHLLQQIEVALPNKKK
jgi:hypothetical protein